MAQQQEKRKTTPNQRDNEDDQSGPSEEELTALARAWAEEQQEESADDVFNELLALLQHRRAEREEEGVAEEEEEPQLDLGLIALIDRANQAWDDLENGPADEDAAMGSSSSGEGEAPELLKKVASKLRRKHARLHEALRALMSSSTSALSAVEEATKLADQQPTKKDAARAFAKASCIAANEAAINCQMAAGKICEALQKRLPWSLPLVREARVAVLAAILAIQRSQVVAPKAAFDERQVERSIKTTLTSFILTREALVAVLQLLSSEAMAECIKAKCASKQANQERLLAEHGERLRLVEEQLQQARALRQQQEEEAEEEELLASKKRKQQDKGQSKQ